VLSGSKIMPGLNIRPAAKKMGFRVFNSNQLFEKKFKFSFNSYWLYGILSDFLLTRKRFYYNFFRMLGYSAFIEFTFAQYAMDANLPKQ